MTHEETYLGYLLMHPDRYHEQQVKPEDFLSPKCRKVWEVMGELLGQKKAVDVASVTFEAKVDPVWMSGLTMSITRNVDLLVAGMVEASRRHRLKLMLAAALERVEEPIEVVLEYIEKHLTDITEGREDDVRKIGDGVVVMVNEFERRYKAKGQIPGISTGLGNLDNILGGWEPSRMYVIGARPSDGKSALLLNFAINAAKSGIGVGFISVESGYKEVTERSFANVSGINGNSIRRGLFADHQFNDLVTAAETITSLPIWIADRPNMRIDEIKGRARRMVRTNGVKMLCVDYVQLVQSSEKLNDYERVSQVSVALKALSRELKVPVIVAAQLNRGADEGKNRKPKISDFKNSGQIEQDADAAILIYNFEDDLKEEQTWLCVEKNRDGRTGDIRVKFDKARMRFGDYVSGGDM